MKIFRIALLAAALLAARELPAQSGRVVISSDAAVVGSPWVVTLFVDHAVPDEVLVTAPSFPGTLLLDKYFKSPRMAGAVIETYIEYTFIPARAGTVRIEPFTITTPEGTVRTAPFTLTVRDPAQGLRPLFPSLSWRQMDGGILELRVTGIEASRLPPQGFFFPEVPRGLILTALPLTDAERETGTAIRLRFIPLETRELVLPARVLRYENIVFEIPALRARISE